MQLHGSKIQLYSPVIFTSECLYNISTQYLTRSVRAVTNSLVEPQTPHEQTVTKLDYKVIPESRKHQRHPRIYHSGRMSSLINYTCMLDQDVRKCYVIIIAS